MAKKLHVGSLSYDTTTDTLSELFGTIGTVSSVAVINDRETGRSKGFAFVEMADDAAAQKAISDLNGRELDGRTITVAEARPPRDRNDRFGGGGGGGGGGYRSNDRPRSFNRDRF